MVVVYYVPLGHVDYLDNWREGTYGFSLGQNSPAIAEVSNPKLIADGMRPGDRVGNESVFDGLRARAISARGRPHDASFRHKGRRENRNAHGVSGRYRSISGRASAASRQFCPARSFSSWPFMLVFFRPSVMTWMFYIFAVGYFGTKPSIAYYDFLPESLYRPMMFFLGTLFSNFAALPLVQFVLRFPDNDVTDGLAQRSANRHRVDLCPGRLRALRFQLVRAEPARESRFAWLAALAEQLDLPLSAFVVSALLLVKKFKLSPPEIRQRMVWLILGMVISFVAYAVYFIPGIAR